MLSFFPRLMLIAFILSFLAIGLSLIMAPATPERPMLTFSTSNSQAQSKLYLYDLDHKVSVPIVFEHSHSNYSPYWTPSGNTLFYTLTNADAVSRVLQWDPITGHHEQIYPPAQNTDSELARMALINIAAVDDSQAIIVVNRPLTYDLYQIDVDNGIIHPLEIRELNAETVYCKTADGHVRYVQHSRGDRDQIEAYEYQNDEAVLLKTWQINFAIGRRTLTLAPDCERFFTSGMTNQELNFEIYLFDLNHDEIINVSNRNLFNDVNPAWTSDSQALAFISTNSGTHFIIHSTLTGQDQYILHESDASSTTLKWSPDDTHLAILYHDPKKSKLCVVDRSGIEIDCFINLRGIYDVQWRIAQ